MITRKQPFYHVTTRKQPSYPMTTRKQPFYHMTTGSNHVMPLLSGSSHLITWLPGSNYLITWLLGNNHLFTQPLKEKGSNRNTLTRNWAPVRTKLETPDRYVSRCFNHYLKRFRTILAVCPTQVLHIHKTKHECPVAFCSDWTLGCSPFFFLGPEGQNYLCRWHISVWGKTFLKNKKILYTLFFFFLYVSN